LSEIFSTIFSCSAIFSSDSHFQQLATRQLLKIISKMQTCLSDKMHPKKLKLKNEKNGKIFSCSAIFSSDSHFQLSAENAGR
jgi:hypothetical protein